MEKEINFVNRKSLFLFSFIFIFLFFISFSSASTDLASLEIVDYCLTSDDIYWFDLSQYYDFNPTTQFPDYEEDYYYKLIFVDDDGGVTLQNYLFMNSYYQYASIDSEDIPRIATDYTWVGIEGKNWNGSLSIRLYEGDTRLFTLDDIVISDSCSSITNESWLPVLTNKTSFYWSYDNVTADEIFDDIFSNDGSVTPGSADIVSGKVGDSIFLDGTGETITTGANISLTETFTFGTWLNWTDTSIQSTLFKSDDYWLILDEDFINPGYFFMPDWDYTEGTWAYLVIIYDGLNMSFYLNGEYVSSGSWVVQPDASILYSSVGSNGGASPSFEGELDETFLVDFALSSDEISQLYNNGIGTSYDEFLNILSLDSFSSTYNGTTYNVNLTEIDYCLNPNYIYWFDYNDYYDYTPICANSSFDNYMFKIVTSASNESFNTTQYIASSNCSQYLSISNTDYGTTYDIYSASDSSWLGFETFFGWEGDIWVSLTHPNLSVIHTLNSTIHFNSSCSAPSLCSYSNIVFCQNEIDCEGVGGFWHNFVCYSEPFCTNNTLSFCDSESDCWEANGYWIAGSCYQNKTSSLDKSSVDKFNEISDDFGEFFPDDQNSDFNFKIYWIVGISCSIVLFLFLIKTLGTSLSILLSFVSFILLSFFFARINYIGYSWPSFMFIGFLLFLVIKFLKGNS